MRRLAIVVVVAACSHTPGTSHDALGCQVVRAGECCDGRGCASGTGTLTVTVLDATTQAPVAGQVTFTSAVWDGAMPFACTTQTSPCPSWQLGVSSALGEGALTLTATASGYTPATFDVTLDGPTGCCGFGAPTTATVALSR